MLNMRKVELHMLLYGANYSMRPSLNQCSQFSLLHTQAQISRTQILKVAMVRHQAQACIASPRRAMPPSVLLAKDLQAAKMWTLITTTNLEL